VGDKSSSHWPITLTNGVAAVFNVFLPVALVRILSPDQIGQYKVFFLYVMLSPALFLTSGLTNGLYHWVGKYPEAKAEVRQSWTFLAGICLALSATGLIFSRPLAALLRIPSLDLRLFLIAVPFAVGSLFLEDLMIARGDIWTGSFYSAGFNVIRAASILAAAWWARNVESVLWVFLAGSVLRVLVEWRLVSTSGEIKLIFSREKSANVLRYALPVSLAALAGLALANVDQMILSFRLSPAKFAFYAMGCLSLPPLEIFETSVNRVLIPGLSRAFAAREFSRASALFADAVSELWRFLLPATLGLMIYSSPIIQILFTPRYLAAAGYLRFYALYYLFYSLPFDAVARARGDSGWILRMSLLFAPLSLLATWLAIGRWGAMGALMAVLAIKLVMRLYSLTYDHRCFAASYAEFLPFKEILLQTGLASAAAACSLLLRPLFSDPRHWFLVTGPLFTLVYFGGTYGLFLRRHFAASGPIHVLELSQSLGFGGLERAVYALSRTLSRHERFKVLVAVYDHEDGQPSLAAQFEEEGIPLVRWQKGKGFSFRNVFRLVYMIFSEKTRILHVHDLGPLIYGSLAKLFSFGRVRLVLTLHTLLDIQQNRRYRLYYKLFLHFADRIIAVSPGVEAGLLALGISPARISVIPNGASFSLRTRGREPTEKLALRKQILPELAPDLYAARWMLCLARLHPGKGQDIVLNLWSALPPSVRAESVLFFVGQETKAGYLEWLRQRIVSSPDASRIIITGPSERVQEWIQSSDLFISGSLLEGMPLAPLEAAGCGLPTLLSDIEGHRFLDPWVRYFDPQKPDEGARKILEILQMLKDEEGNKLSETRWESAAPLRQMWGVPTMTASYAEAFESA